MNTCEPRIWVYKLRDNEMRAALAAGWRRCDLWWERLQEHALGQYTAGRHLRAVSQFRVAYGLARWIFGRADPRYATSLANLAFVDRAAGRTARANYRYTLALAHWQMLPNSAFFLNMSVRPRARSSLFHLRMEARHWDTYRANMHKRLGLFIGESAQCLQSLADGDNVPHRLYSRWAGEKPAVFDDTRKVLGACLLLAAPSR